MAGILSNVELNYQQIQRKNWRVQGRSMFRREQAVRAIKLVQGGLLEVRQEADIQSQCHWSRGCRWTNGNGGGAGKLEDKGCNRTVTMGMKRATNIL